MATTTAGSVKGRARFAAACGVLSQYVKAAAMEAEVAARPAPAVVALPLMPGADVSTPTTSISQVEEQEPASCTPSTRRQSSQMSVFYGGRVLVLDDVPADRAAEVLRLAAAAAKGEARTSDDPMPVARKASLQRFMEKRRSRAAARASETPYSRPADHEGDGDAACSLTLSL